MVASALCSMWWLDVVTQHGGVVHLVDVVAGEDQHIFGIELLDKGQILVDGVGGAFVPFAGGAGVVGGQHVHAALADVQIPGRARADVGVELQGTILGQHAHGVNAAVGAVGQREIDDAVFAAEGCRRRARRAWPYAGSARPDGCPGRQPAAWRHTVFYGSRTFSFPSIRIFLIDMVVYRICIVQEQNAPVNGRSGTKGDKRGLISGRSRRFCRACADSACPAAPAAWGRCRGSASWRANP